MEKRRVSIIVYFYKQQKGGEKRYTKNNKNRIVVDFVFVLRLQSDNIKLIARYLDLSFPICFPNLNNIPIKTSNIVDIYNPIFVRSSLKHGSSKKVSFLLLRVCVGKKSKKKKKICTSESTIYLFSFYNLIAYLLRKHYRLCLVYRSEAHL